MIGFNDRLSLPRTMGKVSIPTIKVMRTNNNNNNNIDDIVGRYIGLVSSIGSRGNTEVYFLVEILKYICISRYRTYSKHLLCKAMN